MSAWASFSGINGCSSHTDGVREQKRVGRGVACIQVLRPLKNQNIAIGPVLDKFGPTAIGRLASQYRPMEKDRDKRQKMPLGVTVTYPLLDRLVIDSKQVGVHYSNREVCRLSACVTMGISTVVRRDTEVHRMKGQPSSFFPRPKSVMNN